MKMKLSIGIGLAVVLGLVIFFGPSLRVLEAGQTYYVDKLGNDSNSCATAETASSTRANAKLTINAGMACMTNNDTDVLIIGAGTYADSLNAGQGTNFPTGTSFTNAAEIKARTSETVIIDPPFTTYAPLYISGKAFIKWTDLIFNGDSQTAGEGHVFTGFNVDSNRFTRVTFRNSPTGSGTFIDDQSSFNEFLQCTFENNGNNFNDHGIYISGTDNLIDGSISKDNSGYGVHIFKISTSVSRNVVRNSQIFHNGEDGGASSLSFGIALCGGSNNQAYNNLVYENGVGSGRAGGIQVGCSSTALCTNCLVYNNTIINKDDTSNDNYALSIGHAGSTGVIYRNNIIIAQTFRVNDVPGSTGSNNIVQAGYSGLFIDEPNDDYHPASGTVPMVNAGCNAGAASPTGCGTSALTFTTDIAGTTRGAGGTGTGTNFDIGAYEFASPPTSITLLVPSASSISWVIGSTQTVTWDTNGTIAAVDIFEDQNGDGTTYETRIGADNIPNTDPQSVSFTVSGSANANRKMQICASTGSPCDTSDNVYAVTSASSPKVITMTQPATGNHYFPGQSVPVGWDSTGLSGNFDTFISYNAGVSYQPTAILSAAFNAPAVSWTAVGPAGTTIRFKTCAQGADAAVCGETGNFKIAGTYLSIR